MNPIDETVNKENATVIAPGFLESSEETACMKPFRDHSTVPNICICAHVEILRSFFIYAILYCREVPTVWQEVAPKSTPVPFSNARR